MHGARCRCLLTALALTTLVAVDGSVSAWAWTSRYGHVSAPDGVLRPGCHHYRYHYVVRPPTSDWILETWLDDPRGKPRGSGDLAPGSDPRRGTARFGICRPTVVPGRFTIRARLRWYTPGMLPTDPPVQHHRWFRPAHFRLRR